MAQRGRSTFQTLDEKLYDNQGEGEWMFDCQSIPDTSCYIFQTSKRNIFKLMRNISDRNFLPFKLKTIKWTMSIGPSPLSIFCTGSTLWLYLYLYLYSLFAQFIENFALLLINCTLSYLYLYLYLYFEVIVSSHHILTLDYTFWLE